MNNTNFSLQDQLQKASEGLSLISESEAPLEPFTWEFKGFSVLNPQTLLQRTKHPNNTPVEVVDFDAFFEVATTEQEWHSAEEREMVKKFQALVKLLKTSLNDLTVYRVGKRAIDVYILGKASTGDYVGLATKVVET